MPRKLERIRSGEKDLTLLLLAGLIQEIIRVYIVVGGSFSLAARSPRSSCRWGGLVNFSLFLFISLSTKGLNIERYSCWRKIANVGSLHITQVHLKQDCINV